MLANLCHHIILFIDIYHFIPCRPREGPWLLDEPAKNEDIFEVKDQQRYITLVFNEDSQRI